MKKSSLLSNRLLALQSHDISSKSIQVRHISNPSIELKTDKDGVRFNFGSPAVNGGSQRKAKKAGKKVKMSKKAKLNELKFYRLKAKKKMNSPNPEVRIRYKLEKVGEILIWHTEGHAIDMNISRKGVLKIINASGETIEINTSPCSGMNAKLHQVAKTYGVVKFRGGFKYVPHWSTDGR